MACDPVDFGAHGKHREVAGGRPGIAETALPQLWNGRLDQLRGPLTECQVRETRHHGRAGSRERDPGKLADEAVASVAADQIPARKLVPPLRALDSHHGAIALLPQGRQRVAPPNLRPNLFRSSRQQRLHVGLGNKERRRMAKRDGLRIELEHGKVQKG